ncbi:MAG: chromate transporter [Candidatus Gastranaerophilales bacterium]|nr:chromate transporter [Candidatus Gastranaerophilales bacterium]
MINVFSIYLIFLKLGLQLIGGGYVILPMLKDEFVTQHKILKETEMIDYVTLSQCLPGLISINVSILIGYKLKGLKGAIAAILGVITSPFLIIIFLANIILYHSNNVLIQNIFWGVRISVVILLFMTVADLFKPSTKGVFGKIMFLAVTIVMLTKVSPALVVVTAGLIGWLYTKNRSKKANL